ncbi:cation:proton antiporter [Weissella halotolerans]|uniref:cation:proton antiporter n=1 Tax=Weissella halotolerans TaxID=1615 RepID=UPI0003B6B98C|nr:cation:proton antiporter [Weissella halotolerans]
MEIVMIGVVLVSALLLGWLGTKIGLSMVVGQLVAGVIVGPALLGWVPNSATIHEIGEIGVLLLMFNAGLETDAQELKNNFKSATSVAVMGVLVPLIVFPIAALCFGDRLQVAIFWGIVFAATSISITIAVLSEQGKLKTLVGSVVLGAAVIDDVLALLLVSTYALLLGGSGIGVSALLPLVLFALGLLTRKWSRSGQLLHYSQLIGDWTLFPIFFGSIGLAVNLDHFGAELPMLIVLTILAVLTKYYGASFGARLTGIQPAASRAIGAGMVSRGEMALVVVQIGLQANILTADEFASFVVVIIVSTIIAPIMLRPLLKRVPVNN